MKTERGDQVDLKATLANYMRFWYLYLIGAALAVGAAFAYLRYYAVPLYSVHAKILIKDDKNGADFSSASAFSELDIFKSSKVLDNEIEVLKSKSLMQRVVRELELNTGYFVEGRFRDMELYGHDLPVKVLLSNLDSTAYGRTLDIIIRDNNSFILNDKSGKLTGHRFGQQIKRPYGTFTVFANPALSLTSPGAPAKVRVVLRSVQEAAKQFNQALNIQPISKNTSVLQVSTTDPIPQRAQDIINKLIEVYNKEAIEDKNLIASSTLEFIDERLKYLTAELSSVEKDVETFKRQNELTDVNSQASNYLQQASDYNRQLSDWAIQIDVLESIEAYLQQGSNQYKMVPSSLGIQDPTLQGLLAKFNELQLERERMLRTVQPGNPLVLNLNEQLDNLRVNVLENLRNIKKGLVITSKNLKANSGQFKSRIRHIPSVERELLEINRQQSIKQELYLYLLQKREETALSLAASVSNSRIIDPAMGSNIPVSPKKSTLYLMAFLLGISLPLGAVYLMELLNDKVQTKQDVENITSTPILGELMHNKYREPLIVTEGNNNPLVEMFRLIRANLQFVAVGRENKVIMVTSSLSGEGKSFFSINLGASLVLMGKKVLLLELDLRKPDLSEKLGLPEELGVTDYLVSDEVEIHDIIRVTDKMPDLYVISCGALPPNPAELMMSTKLQRLLAELKKSFDHIIIDTPPIGQVADAYTLSSEIDSTIYIVRYNHTPKKQLELIQNIYTARTLRHPMLVLNDAKKRNANSYGYGYGYPAKKQKSVLS